MATRRSAARRRNGLSLNVRDGDPSSGVLSSSVSNHPLQEPAAREHVAGGRSARLHPRALARHALPPAVAHHEDVGPAVPGQPVMSMASVGPASRARSTTAIRARASRQCRQEPRSPGSLGLWNLHTGHRGHSPPHSCPRSGFPSPPARGAASRSGRVFGERQIAVPLGLIGWMVTSTGAGVGAIGVWWWFTARQTPLAITRTVWLALVLIGLDHGSCSSAPHVLGRYGVPSSVRGVIGRMRTLARNSSTVTSAPVRRAASELRMAATTTSVRCAGITSWERT